MHEIEDLVEDTVRTVLGSSIPVSEKCRLVFNLYRVQGWFDTGNTMARVDVSPIGYDANAQYPITPLVTLTATVMQLANDRALVHDWLGLLQQALTDLEIGDEAPRSPSALDSDAHAIRRLAIEHRVDRYYGGHLRLTGWPYFKDTLSEADSAALDHKHVVRFFSDLKADAAKLAAEHTKAHERLAALESGPLFRIPALVSELAGFTFSHVERDRYFRTFIFEPCPAAADATFYFAITHDASMHVLSAKVGVRRHLLSAWQENSSAPHFWKSLALYAEADSEMASAGAWPYKATQSEKILRKKLAAMLSHWPSAAPFVELHTKPLRPLLESSTLDALEKRRRELRDTLGFFLNDIELMFAYACLASDREPLRDRIAKGLAKVSDAYHLKPHWVRGGAKLDHSPWFPPLEDTLPYKPLDT